jgi:hypothetical protein
MPAHTPLSVYQFLKEYDMVAGLLSPYAFFSVLKDENLIKGIKIQDFQRFTVNHRKWWTAS